MSGVTTLNLSRFYDNFCMQLAMEVPALLMHGLKTAVEREVTGTDINAAASSWVTAGWLTQAQATEIADLVTARDTPSEEPEEPEEPGGEEPSGGE